MTTYDTLLEQKKTKTHQFQACCRKKGERNSSVVKGVNSLHTSFPTLIPSTFYPKRACGEPLKKGIKHHTLIPNRVRPKTVHAVSKTN